MALFGGRSRRANRLWGPVGFSPARFPSQDAQAVAGTKVDWEETDEAHVFKAHLPGLKKGDIKVEVEDNSILRISGERDKKGDRWHTGDRSDGTFLRKFQLPDNAQANSVSAKVENDVLIVTVLKTQTKTSVKRKR